MKKIKKEINQVIMVIGFAVVLLGILTFDIAERDTYIIWSTSSLASMLAVCFVFSKNDTVKNIGYALAALVGIYGMTTLVYEVNVLASIGMLLMFVSSLMYFFVVCLAFFGFVKIDEYSSKNNNDAIALLAQYKDMEKESLISQEEFLKIKREILDNARGNASGVEELKKWKKLLDQRVINDEEFSGIKSKIFSIK